MLISLAEYAQMHGKEVSGIRRKCINGGFKTAQKIGRNWVIDSEEPLVDQRVTSGKYRNWRKEKKSRKFLSTDASYVRKKLILRE